MLSPELDHMTFDPYNGVKVFSATKAGDRENLGEKVTAWMRAHPQCRIVNTTVAQSSDASFHCLSIVLFWNETPGAAP
jgi:hypothetical protein